MDTEFHDIDICPGQEVVIGGDILVWQVQCRNQRKKASRARLGVDAPAGSYVMRGEHGAKGMTAKGTT